MWKLCIRSAPTTSSTTTRPLPTPAKSVGGMLQQTAEAKVHRYATMQEVCQQHYLVPHKEFHDDIGMTTGDDTIPLKLVGPEGRLGRTGRMVWDAFSLMEEPKQKGPSYILPYLGSEFGWPEFEELV